MVQLCLIGSNKGYKKIPGKWDGKSRIPTQLYKDNYNRIFGKKDDKRKNTTKGRRPKNVARAR